ncbi:MAG TPA: aminotransferase class V-fold PLP-dependent enzyme, partial [Abditibacteriaceae bacterium]|nr:aminotransferase class V-fold PLP-dependent enzyme [Abditibacteriaceae bacterium]
EMYNRAKTRVARLMLGVETSHEDVAFAGSTSGALGIVATGINWKSGDNCVVADGDFPANVVPWKNLQHRHEIDVRLIPFRPQMQITLDDVKPLVDERTRIVSLCSANFLSGCPINITEIGQWLRERNVLFCVDAIQTLGAIEFDATYVDFVCADAHKWLLGPNGIAVLWSPKEARQQLRPAILGWLAPRERDNWFAYDTTPLESAERFEPGARNYIGAVALDAVLAQHEEIGAKTVEERVVALRNYAVRVLEGAGCELLYHPQTTEKAGIVSFRHPQRDTEELFNALSEHFALSIRADKSGQKWIRVSAGWMNTESDLNELAKHL